MTTTPAAPDSPKSDSSTPYTSAPDSSTLGTSTLGTSAPATPSRRVSRGTAITLTIVFLALLLVLVVALFVPALFLVMSTAGCSDSCNLDVMQAGINVAVLGPGLVFIANLIVSIVFLVKKRTAWWLSLLGAVASMLAYLLGLALVFGQTG